jgi:hypothetical protein
MFNIPTTMTIKKSVIIQHNILHVILQYIVHIMFHKLRIFRKYKQIQVSKETLRQFSRVHYFSIAIHVVFF